MTRESDRQSKADSRRIIDRVSREADAGGRPPPGVDGKGYDAEPEDWVDVWGTRIGRSLGFLVVIGLIVYLGLLVTRGG